MPMSHTYRTRRSKLESRRRLFAEQLESRLLLAAKVSVEWFASFDSSYGPMASGAANFAATPPVATSWIVQLTDDALEQLPTPADVPQLFAQQQLPVRAIRGLGLAGQVLVEALPGRAGEAKAALDMSDAIAEVSANGLMRGQVDPNDPQFGQKVP